MRVLLFVSCGDWRPKVISRKYEKDVRARADRWWLVECENADAGRRVIGAEPGMDATGMGHHEGRILASGGKP